MHNNGSDGYLSKYFVKICDEYKLDDKIEKERNNKK